MNFFKLYIGDYQRDTAHLSIAEHGAYMLMLQHYYATEKPLPTGKALHRMLRAQDKTERDAIDSIVRQFWKASADGLVNERADDEIDKASAQAQTNARIAREREDKRRVERESHEQSTNRATNDQPNHSHSHNQEKTKALPRKTRLPDGFAISDRVRNWAAEKGYDRLDEHFEYFIGYAKSKGATYIDWDEAFMNAIRSNWAKLGVSHGTYQRADNSAVARVERAYAHLDEPDGKKVVNGERVE